jgi:hypothetical protein
MRVKKLVCVVSFNNTTEAIAFEEEAKKKGLPGRIIPLPRQISSGCGLAWKDEIESIDKIKELLKETQIPFKEVHQILL